MDNLYYSLNATLPIFFIMVIGFLLKQRGAIKEGFIQGADSFNFNVTLPVLLFKDIAGSNFIEIFDVGYVIFCMTATTICFFLIWGGAKFFLKDKSMIGAFVQASYRSSAAILGIAFIQNIYGTSGMAPLMIIGTVPLYNVFAVLVLTLEGKQETSEPSHPWKKILINIVKNPILLAILAGILVSLLRINFPIVINKTIQNLAAMATPLALISIGAGFEGRSAISKIKPTLVATAIKLILQGIVFIPIAIYIGFRTEKLVALLIMLTAPATPSCYIMARNMKNDIVLTSSIIVSTTFLGAFTLTGWIYLLRMFQYI